ncbi:MAG: error-prone DNA polymerase [Casimicrobiaceae bacterium]|nr:error-prone DNA polymerase [Casimicrobiaceae bacterium]MDW8312000.1 error-prone DNA polymerase [Burkholderiales bacterium]
MLPVYAELCAQSSFSFLTGASQPEELVRQAHALGYRALALTDECSLAGVVRAHLEAAPLAAPGSRFRFIVGSLFGLPTGLRFVLLAQTRRGYGDLCMLITRARSRSAKGCYQLELDDLAPLRDCQAIVLPERSATPEAHDALLEALSHLPTAIGYTRLLSGDDAERFVEAQALAARHALPLTAVGQVLMHERSRQRLADVLAATREKTTVFELAAHAQPNAERVLRPLSALATLYPSELLLESALIAERCLFSLDELRYEYPEEIVPPGHTPASYLRQETYAGAQRRYGAELPDAVCALLEKELALIAELGYEPYFLTVYDIVCFARSRGILCQGRGSAANSAVCYCLGITEVDPSRMAMLFERFVSKERNEPPDIDVDFEHERREEVIQYVYAKYGRHRAALCAAVTTYRLKGALRDVGRALGLAADQLDAISRQISGWDREDDLPARLREAGFDPEQPRIATWIALTRTLIGFPRHLSQHTGGFVIARDRLDRLVPIENAAMPERTVIQWDKDDIEALGLLKVDLLGLGMLSALRRALDSLSAERGRPFTLADIPPEDPAVYDMLCRGESTGVFQVESRAQMNMLPRLRPRNFFDLVIEVAIVRPGPIQGGMVHPYLRRRQGLEPVSYPSKAVEGVLARTLGVPIFQEQVMQLAMVAAGFSAGEADQLRRAMAAWRRKGGLGHLEDRLKRGLLANGYTREFADAIYAQIQGFGTYGFPESHAASFALLVYASAWIKCHHPAHFLAALLNAQPMGFYAPAQLVQEAQRAGVTVLPVDVNESAWDCRSEEQNGQRIVRLGLRMVAGLPERAGRALEAARAAGGPFRSIAEAVERAGLDARAVQALAAADAFRSVAGHRVAQRWQAAAARLPALPITGGVEANAPPAPAPPGLPALSEAQEVVADYRALGLTLRAHPLALLRPRLAGIRRAADLPRLPHGMRLRVAGLVTCRQRPGTAGGVTFVTLEDETGNANVILWRHLAEAPQARRALVTARLLIVHGRLERQGPITHVIAETLEDASELLGALVVASHDFH